MAAGTSHAQTLAQLPNTALALSRILERGRRKLETMDRYLPPPTSHIPPPVAPVSRKSSGYQQGTLHDRYPSMRLIAKHANQQTWRVRLWLVLQDPSSSRLARVVSTVLIVAVVLATCVFLLQTEPSFEPYASTLSYLETLCVALFTIDVLVRFLCVPHLGEFARDVFNWIDVASVVPFYLEAFLANRPMASLSSLRALRLLRVARIFKLSRYTSSIQMFLHAIRESSQALFILLFLVSITMLFFSSALYYANAVDEAGCIPAIHSVLCSPLREPAPPAPCCHPTPFYSIAAALWWCIATMTTVGYGDDVPATPPAQAIASVALLAGILILSLPTSVIGSNFQRLFRAAHTQVSDERWVEQRTTDQPCSQTKVERMQSLLLAFRWSNPDRHVIEYSDLLSIYDEKDKGHLSDSDMDTFRHDLERLDAINLVEHTKRATRSDVKKEPRLETHARRDRFLATADETIQYRLLESEALLESKLRHIIQRIVALDQKLHVLSEDVE
ncbi:hypothetical protein SPRG_10252 [Saprolegnia parasitica CBS 223.65]|uniref:Ion transport domain-containing protein n=1 Tax=Saprolegnia parasitica (strain CBS 223.65) TaxID=695850 RepID=A0A067C2K2_SAPPC|nr:hypothetical protein SPRG_10252 [Saprolegnia parasitica CBS 223.65]KDO24718.1 hypothetical protein SPRG_10252 [Saprolegnia parasitica CBS 223.65]|eukprot:XP_012204598.1 hypothetical protein SPRG_10252 [Saprolegnia parasitica CBS 223.65]